MNCPSCKSKLEKAFIYVRGFGGSLFWSTSDSTSFFSRKNLEQIDLGELSTTPTGAQAVVPAFRCNKCSIMVFKSI